MKKKLYQLYQNSVIRYLFFGGCTTGVNMVSFYCLRKMGVTLNLANFISIILAILFAYIVNAKFVFRSGWENGRELLRSFLKFVSARAVTMLIEVAGVWLLVDVVQMQEMFGKLLIQFVIIILNYVFSKVFVFAKKN